MLLALLAHAGKVFTNIESKPAPRDAIEGRLNIHPYSAQQGSIDPASPFTADGAVQAYNYRFSVTNDPANRIPFSPGDFDGRLVRFEARLVEVLDALPGQQRLVLATRASSVIATLESGDASALAGLRSGSRLAVTGIARLGHG